MKTDPVLKRPLVWPEIERRAPVVPVVAPPRSLVSPIADFWLIGGASIIVWMILSLSQWMRESSFAIESHFAQLGATFGILTLFCNYPHFLMSYRLAYGRGWRFIATHSLALIVVPVLLIGAYIWAFTHFHSSIDGVETTEAVSSALSRLGIDFKIGSSLNLGTEILALSIWLMYLTVGWHYSKQIFGCIMVYSKFENYKLDSVQRQLIKVSVFSVAFFNFVYMSNVYSQSGQFHPTYFFSVPITTLGLANFYLITARVWLALSMASVLYFVVYRNYLRHKAWPSWNVAVAWVAFHIWWIPMLRQQEYYLLLVPFFHSLQYLPFALKMEKAGKPSRSRLRQTLFLFGVVAIGVVMFELVPEALDHSLNTEINEVPWFFTIAFIVFINIHHFFIDSVIWRLRQTDVQKGLFNTTAA